MNKTQATPKKASRWRRWSLEALIFVVAIIGFQLWQTRNAPSGPVPNFQGHTLDGQAFDFATWRAQHPDKPSLIYFWAEWCGVCKSTAGTVGQISQDYPTVTVAIQSGDSDKVAALMHQRGYVWQTTLADPETDLFDLFRLRAVPDMIIVSPNGEISSVSLGYTSELGLRLRLWWAGLKA